MNGDVTDELDETFTVTLSTPVNATLLDAQGIGTITDDDGFPSLSINDVTVTETNGGTVNAVFNVSLSNERPAGQRRLRDGRRQRDRRRRLHRRDGDAHLPAGRTAQRITVAVAGDVLDEADETLQVVLSAPTNATLGDAHGLGTITDDDAAPSLSIADVSAAEGGNDGAHRDPRRAERSRRERGPCHLGRHRHRTRRLHGRARDPDLRPGRHLETVTVLVNGDTLDEANETFTVNLSNATNATIGDGQR